MERIVKKLKKEFSISVFTFENVCQTFSCSLKLEMFGRSLLEEQELWPLYPKSPWQQGASSEKARPFVLLCFLEQRNGCFGCKGYFSPFLLDQLRKDPVRYIHEFVLFYFYFYVFGSIHEFTYSDHKAV